MVLRGDDGVADPKKLMVLCEDPVFVDGIERASDRVLR